MDTIENDLTKEKKEKIKVLDITYSSTSSFIYQVINS